MTTLAISGATSADDGTYSVTVTNVAGGDSSAGAVLTVTNIPALAFGNPTGPAHAVFQSTSRSHYFHYQHRRCRLHWFIFHRFWTRAGLSWNQLARLGQACF